MIELYDSYRRQIRPIPLVPVPNSHNDDALNAAEKAIPKEGSHLTGMHLYVCGITPYDATHIGHAATYLTFDILHRVCRAEGIDVRYVQNVTDIDDPLLERADRDGVDWYELAMSQQKLFDEDMDALNILKPDHVVPVTTFIEPIAAAIHELLEQGTAYIVPDGSGDNYYDIAQVMDQWPLPNMDEKSAIATFVEFGGDPDRGGKRSPLDPLLWRAVRAHELDNDIQQKHPRSWNTILGRGRPGWHIECSVISENFLGHHVSVQGGGADLHFPHHWMSSAHAYSLNGVHPGHQIYAHAGLISYQGEKMSKSLGNLVLVSALRKEGVDPRAIRLALMAGHYRQDREWTQENLEAAQDRLDTWTAFALRHEIHGCTDKCQSATAELKQSLRQDLDTPQAVNIVDMWAKISDSDTEVSTQHGLNADENPVAKPDSPGQPTALSAEFNPAHTCVMITAIESLLGIRLQ